MASAYSTLKKYGKFIAPFNIDLANSVLAAQQNKFDVRAAALQDSINKMSELDLYRDVDKEYLANRIEGIVDSINETKGYGLETRGVYNKLQTSIAKAADKNVLSALQSSANYKALKEEIELAKTSKEGYSKQNEAFAMQGAFEWLNSKDLGKKFKGGSYIPYVDVEKKLNENLVKFVEDNGEMEYEINDGKGRIQKIKVKDMDAYTLRSIAQKSISTQDKVQIDIDSWYNYGGLAEPELMKLGESFLVSAIKELDSSRTYYEKEVKNNPKDAYAFNKLNTTVNEINRLKSVASSITSVQDMRYMLESEKLIDNAATRNVKHNQSTTSGVDEAFFKSLSYNLNASKLNETIRHNSAMEGIGRFNAETNLLKAQAKAAEDLKNNGVENAVLLSDTGLNISTSIEFNKDIKGDVDVGKASSVYSKTKTEVENYLNGKDYLDYLISDNNIDINNENQVIQYAHTLKSDKQRDLIISTLFRTNNLSKKANKLFDTTEGFKTLTLGMTAKSNTKAGATLAGITGGTSSTRTTTSIKYDHATNKFSVELPRYNDFGEVDTPVKRDLFGSPEYFEVLAEPSQYKARVFNVQFNRDKRPVTLKILASHTIDGGGAKYHYTISDALKSTMYEIELPNSLQGEELIKALLKAENK